MGRVTQVFGTPRELQGAYDFLEERHAKAGPIVEATGVQSVRRAGHRGHAIVALDGSSVSVVDRTGKKGLGSLGSYQRHGRGVKMINALAIGLDGATLGLVDQQYWHRAWDASRSVRAGAIKKKRNRKAPAAAKETQRWLDAIDSSERRFKAHADHVGRIYVLDREADSRDLLAKLGETGQGFIVRSSWDRCVEVEGIRGARHLRSFLSSLPALGRREVPIAGTAKRAARTARMELRATAVTLLMRAQHGRRALLRARVHVVQAREVGTTPVGEKPLEWTLLTNLDVSNLQAVQAVLDHYTLRWRIEDFHKSLKTGGCNAESMQLRSPDAVIKWATILSAVAARNERLKHLARNDPEQPATIELTALEIRVLLLLKRKEKKRTESVPNAIPTIATATRWLADLGGYTGKSSGGPPGAITIGRGLQRVLDGADVLAALENERSDQ